MYQFLYQARIRRGYTQAELAKLAGVSRRTICDLEQSGRIPSPRVGLRLCKALGCRYVEVFPVEVLLLR